MLNQVLRENELDIVRVRKDRSAPFGHSFDCRGSRRHGLATPRRQRLMGVELMIAVGAGLPITFCNRVLRQWRS